MNDPTIPFKDWLADQSPEFHVEMLRQQLSDRDDRIDTLEADWALVEMWLGATDHKAGAASLATFLNKYRKEATDD